MQNYETIIITTPVLTDAQVKETLSRYTSFLKENKCKIINEENWGLKKLAYPIQKKNNGYYLLIEFQGEGDIINKLEINYKRDVNIMRFLTTRQDKYAVEYSERRRKKISSCEIVKLWQEEVKMTSNLSYRQRSTSGTLRNIAVLKRWALNIWTIKIRIS